MTPSASHGTRVFSMASGTLVSRLTGLLRVLVLAWVLGFTPIADSFNLANTVPNMLFDLVLGGVLGATFIPVFVERLALDGQDVILMNAPRRPDGPPVRDGKPYSAIAHLA